MTLARRPSASTSREGQTLPDHVKHIAQAQALRPDWIVLHRQRPTHEREPWLSNRQACVDFRAAGLVCDEYPFASAEEGGEANVPSVYGVDPGESSVQGGTLGSFYGRRACRPFGQGTPFIVVPVPSDTVPTFHVCRP